MATSKIAPTSINIIPDGTIIGQGADGKIYRWNTLTGGWEIYQVKTTTTVSTVNTPGGYYIDPGASERPGRGTGAIDK